MLQVAAMQPTLISSQIKQEWLIIWHDSYILTNIMNIIYQPRLELLAPALFSFVWFLRLSCSRRRHVYFLSAATHWLKVPVSGQEWDDTAQLCCWCPQIRNHLIILFHIFQYCQTQFMCSHRHIFQLNEFKIVIWSLQHTTELHLAFLEKQFIECEKWLPDVAGRPKCGGKMSFWI